jgi:putative polyhydroxyalkanoate system protein
MFGSPIVVRFAFWLGGGAPRSADLLPLPTLASAATGHGEGGRRALTLAPRLRERGPLGYTSPSLGRCRMALITIEKEHSLSHKKAKEAAENVAKDLHARFDLDYKWEGDDIAFRRPGLSGALHVGKDDVRLDCELGFMLSLLKPTIETEVHKQFDKYFGKAKGKRA